MAMMILLFPRTVRFFALPISTESSPIRDRWAPGSPPGAAAILSLWNPGEGEVLEKLIRMPEAQGGCPACRSPCLRFQTQSVLFFVEFLNLMNSLMTKDVVSLFSKGTSRKNGSYCMGY